jgi:hypothetical protein
MQIIVDKRLFMPRPRGKRKFDPGGNHARPRKPGRMNAPIGFAVIPLPGLLGDVSLILSIRTFKDIPTFPMGVVSGFRFYLQNNLPLCPCPFVPGISYCLTVV